jgi:hypothetical protein
VKIYVVTTGSYSDYGIHSVFLDKEKALQCISLLKDSNNIEEYESSDEIKQRCVSEFHIYAELNNGNLECKVYYNKTDPFDDYDYKDRTIVVILVWENNKLHLSMDRFVYDENMTYEKIEFYTNKFEKAGQDMWYIIQQKLSEGYNLDQINEMINS